MPSPASDIYRQLAYKVESAYGTVPAASGAQLLRRTGSNVDLSKDTYKSNEVRTDFQVADFRHGVRKVAGKIGGELSAKTYADVFAALLKRDFAAVTALTALSLTIAGSGPTYTITRAAGDYLAGGLKVGDVIRLSVGVLNALNINKNLMIVSLTANIATVITLNGSAMFAEGPIASCTVSVVGKKTYIPQTGHTDKSFSIEHWHSDLAQSEVYSGCKFTQIGLSLPPTGLATIDIDVMGQNVTTAAAQYFTSPTAQTTTGSMAAVNGVLRIGGVTVATVTGLSLTIAGGFGSEAVVGANTMPGQNPGTVEVTGQATVFFDSITLRDAFFNETELDLLTAFTADNTAASDFITFILPRIKLGGATKAPTQGGLTQTIPFQALLNVNGGAGIATEKTTILIQDSQA